MSEFLRLMYVITDVQDHLSVISYFSIWIAFKEIRNLKYYEKEV